MTAHFRPKKVNFELDLSRAFQNEVASFRILSRSAKPFISFYSGFQNVPGRLFRLTNQSEGFENQPRSILYLVYCTLVREYFFAFSIFQKESTVSKGSSREEII